ncbi:MAG: chemotaxis-specific protein-glutamate methyltransferase CheB [Deltaproteobacteria bacterium]|nr:chemotaxis-specific protein-glutamate methyltransferase CheB [Deltaproteobacteria bacterium]
MASKIRVLFADDSALMRRSLRNILEAAGDIEVVGAARDGQDAIEKSKESRPDVILLDINMPRLDGLSALEILVKMEAAPVIIVSSLSQAGAAVTIQALELGAFDYVPKPGGTVSINMDMVARDLVSKVRAAAKAGVSARLRQKGSRSTVRPAARDLGRRPAPVCPAVERRVKSGFGYPVVALGISTGGPSTIYEVLPRLPGSLNAAIFMVQHMPVNFIETFAKRLDRNCSLHCVVAQSGMIVSPGTIYLARGGCHMTLAKKINREVVIRTPTRPPHLFIPSVDVMMRSVYSVYGADTIGVLMTGMGDDGAEAMVEITRGGGITIAESEESAVVWGMPGEAVARGGAKIVAGSWEIADHIIKYVGS